MTGNQGSPGEVFQFKFAVSVTVGVISFLFAALVITLFVSGIIDREVLKFTVSTVTAATAITSAFYVGENIRRTFTSKKTDRALAYIAVWTGPSFAHIRKSSRQIRDAIQGQDSEKHAEIIKKKLNENHDLEEDMVTIMNFLEEVALSIQSGLVDEAILQEYFKVIIKRYCYVFTLWIEEQRRQRGNELYRCLTRLNERWNPH